MVTETENTTTTQQEVVTKPVEQPQVQQPIQIPNELAALQSMYSAEDFGKMVEEYQKTLKPIEQVQTQVTTEVKPIEQTTTIKEEVKPQEVKPHDFGDNPLVADLNKIAAHEPTTQTFEKLEDIFPYLTKETGVEIKGAEDINKLVSTYKETQNNLSKVTDEYQKAKQVEDFFTKMPDDLFGIVTAYANNQDYRAEMHKNINNTIDYSKPFEQQDLKKLLFIYDSENFTSDKFSTDEDYQEFKESDYGKAISKLVKDRFEKEKSVFVDNRTRFMQKSDEIKKKLEASVETTVGDLKTSIPYFKEAQINDVTKTLVGGQNAILSLFFNADGTYTKDAAKKISMIKFGEQAIEKQKEFIRKRLETQVNEELITRGADQPPIKTNGNSGLDSLKADNEARTIVENLTGQKIKTQQTTNQKK